MRYKRILALAIILYGALHAFPQQLFTTTNVQEAQKRLTRSKLGSPGTRYWQNGADYTMHIQFDPRTMVLNGEEDIFYYNNSPDTLKQLIIRLYPDLYKKGVKEEMNIAEKDLNEGLQLDQLNIAGEAIPDQPGNKNAFHSNTNFIVIPRDALLPHSHTRLTVKWHYRVNSGSPVRTGMVDSGAFFIAYFFPRIAVYDDINGWDDWSYNGIQEFYNDFGNFNVDLKVPAGYMVWATGERNNAADNFSPTVLKRLAQLNNTDAILSIIDSNDYSRHQVFADHPTGVWSFTAKAVSDFTFAISNHYLWDASAVLVDSLTKRKTIVSAVYNKAHADYFDVASQAQRSVFLMSHVYPKVPFPFPYITVFDGTDQMEYPMMVNDNPSSSHKDAVQLTSHEIFHSYFPFYMGINETQYAWMDEGWATIGESVISPLMGEPEDEGIYSKGRYERISGTDKDMPLIANTKLYQSAAYLSNSYGKGGLCYWVLQDMLGDALYFKALHRYMSDWHGKHPVPYDFFYSFNAATGRNLNWFWQKWFFDWVYPDLGISRVEQGAGLASISISNTGGLPVPIFLSITTDDGQTKKMHYGADVWQTGKTDFLIRLRLTGKITRVVLGNALTPDKNNSDNSWPAVK